MVGSPNQEFLVIVAFAQDVDRTEDIPPARQKRLDDGLTDVVVGQERKAGDYSPEWRLRYSLRARSPSIPTRACSAKSVSISALLSSAYARAK
jgi:hypothetical protein